MDNIDKKTSKNDSRLKETFPSKSGQKFTRRNFLSKLGITLAGLSLSRTSKWDISEAEAAATSSSTNLAGERLSLVKRLRKKAFDLNFRRSIPKNPNDFSKDGAPYFANFTKGLPHNEFAEVDEGAYKLLLRALKSGKPSDFERLRLGGSKKLKNPLAAYAINFDTYDSHQFSFREAPPKLNSSLAPNEMTELYWMSLCRDINFNDYTTSELINEAAFDLSRFADVNYPKNSAGVVAADNIFRYGLTGDLTGPYISQLLYHDITQGPLVVPQKFKTVISNNEYLTDYTLWKFTQDGNLTGVDQFDPTLRYIRNGRDLGEVIHNDRMPQHFSHAALILQFGFKAHVNQGMPYIVSNTMDGFATFNYFHLQCLLGEVAKRAMWAEFARKWLVWRRLRPEAFGGYFHNTIVNNRTYPIASDVFNSTVLGKVFSKYGTYLLPQQYPEGSPGHPAYGSGHAVVAGACATILKMWFDEDFILTNPVVPNSDGTALVAYTGSGADQLTVGGEVNKLAFNTSLGRLWGGIHYRSDSIAGLKLGGEIAIAYMMNNRTAYREKFDLVFTRFDGRRTRIRN